MYLFWCDYFFLLFIYYLIKMKLSAAILLGVIALSDISAIRINLEEKPTPAKEEAKVEAKGDSKEEAKVEAKGDSKEPQSCDDLPFDKKKACIDKKVE